MSNIWTPYLEAGWQLCEIRPGSKAPRVDGWQKKGAPFSASTLSAGLVHEHSGTCALDIDDMGRAEKWLAERGVDLAGLFSALDRVQLIGNPANHGKLLYRLPAARRSKKVTEVVGMIDGKPQRKNILDFRCVGNQDVLPPSMHPDTGAPYAWHYGDPLLGHWSQLPELPAALDAIWAALVTPLAERPATSDLPAADVSVDDLVAWLDTQDPDGDRDAWVQVGMRVHTATAGQGFYIWDNWSRKGEKYGAPDNVRDMQAAWRSFKVGGGLGVGPILAAHVAKPDEFPLDAPAEFDAAGDLTDDSPGAVSARLLSRLVYIATQDRYFAIPDAERPAKNLDENLNIGLSRNGVNAMFGPHMPRIYHPKTGAASQRKPIDVLEQDMPDKPIVSNIGFHPGAGRLYKDSDSLKYLNRYVPDHAAPLAPIGDEQVLWDRLLARIADDDYRRWLLQFFAFILKHPGVKVQSAPFLYSKKQGTGKTTLMQIVPRLLYGNRYVRLASNDLLQARFTGYLADTWFVVLDEMKGDHGKLDRINLANKLKPWITDPLLPIERKGLDVYDVPNRLQITATSNFDDALHIDNEDRRWGICELGGNAMKETEALDLYAWLNGPRGRGVIRWLFDRVNIAGFDPNRKPPRTDGHIAMVRNSLGNWESRILQAIAAGDPPFDRDFTSLSMVRDILMGQNAPRPNQIADILKAPPINAQQLHAGTVRFYCWRNHKLWADMPQSFWQSHLETGARPPARKWNLEVPLAIRRMAGDDAEPDPNTDLLGNTDA